MKQKITSNSWLTFVVNKRTHEFITHAMRQFGQRAGADNLAGQFDNLLS